MTFTDHKVLLQRRASRKYSTCVPAHRASSRGQTSARLVNFLTTVLHPLVQICKQELELLRNARDKATDQRIALRGNFLLSLQTSRLFLLPFSHRFKILMRTTSNWHTTQGENNVAYKRLISCYDHSGNIARNTTTKTATWSLKDRNYERR